MERREPTQKALVLAGGGARGSYQVGVWRALMELDWHPQIITGTSVGGLNGAMFVLDLYETARDMWLTIRSRDVMELPEENADLSALHQFLRRVVKEGGMDVTPLEEIVGRVMPTPSKSTQTSSSAPMVLARPVGILSLYPPSRNFTPSICRARRAGKQAAEAIR